jgi:hypothetical protein
LLYLVLCYYYYFFNYAWCVLDVARNLPPRYEPTHHLIFKLQPLRAGPVRSAPFALIYINMWVRVSVACQPEEKEASV